MKNNTSLLYEEISCPQSTDQIGVKLGKTLGLSVIMSLTLVGNLLVILVFKRNLTTRTNTNYFIINMAVSDLLFPLFVWPRETANIWLERNRWLLGGAAGQFSCKTIMFLTDISTTVSIQTLVLIAIERFIAVVFPLKVRNFTPRIRKNSTILTWLTAVVVHSPYLYIFKLVSGQCGTLHCIRDWEPLGENQMADKLYSTTLAFILIFIPLTLIFILYTCILEVLRKKKALANPIGEEENARRRKQNRKIIKMCLSIVIAFALCWLPFSVFILLYHYSIVSSSFINRFISVFLFLAYANSAINPWILIYFSQNFRHGLRNMCSCCPCSSESRDQRRDSSQLT